MGENGGSMGEEWRKWGKNLRRMGEVWRKNRESMGTEWGMYGGRIGEDVTALIPCSSAILAEKAKRYPERIPHQAGG